MQDFKLLLRTIFFAAILAMGVQGVSQSDAELKRDRYMQQTSPRVRSFYDFSINTLNGVPFDMKELKGKRVLIVNTASECGNTPQYAQLQELYKMYGGEHFTIVGFPSNDFGGQEPGTNAEIAVFCQKNYGVTFPMLEKIGVKGENCHPLYRWLTLKIQNGVSDAEVTWNFNKFLIDENGNWVAWYPSKVEPLDVRIVDFAAGVKK